MDDITTKAIVIAVNIFVTIAIVTIVITMFFQMKDIYGLVAKTDNSINATFDNVYAMYSGRKMTGVGLLNTIKKYEDKKDEKILIQYPGSTQIKEHVVKNNLREAAYLKSLMEQNKGYKYETKYMVSVDTKENSLIIINFDEI